MNHLNFYKKNRKWTVIFLYYSQTDPEEDWSKEANENPFPSGRMLKLPTGEMIYTQYV